MGFREFDLMGHLKLTTLKGVDISKSGHIIVYDGSEWNTYGFRMDDVHVQKPFDSTQVKIYSRQREPSIARAIQRDSRKGVQKNAGVDTELKSQLLSVNFSAFSSIIYYHSHWMSEGRKWKE